MIQLGKGFLLISAVLMVLYSRPDASSDVLNTPPKINLTDILSSTLQEFPVSPGNYTWTVKKGNENETVTACGVFPPDQQADLPELVIPAYNQMDRVRYRISGFEGADSPDYIRIKKWKDPIQAGNKAEELEDGQIDSRLVELEPGVIYELTLIWEDTRLKERGFSGEAGYVFKTSGNGA